MNGMLVIWTVVLIQSQGIPPTSALINIPASPAWSKQTEVVEISEECGGKNNKIHKLVFVQSSAPSDAHSIGVE